MGLKLLSKSSQFSSLSPRANQNKRCFNLLKLKIKRRNIFNFSFHGVGSEHSLKNARDSNFHFEKQNMFIILSLGKYLAFICM